MNKIFKVIYSKTRHCYVVVSELAKSHCKTAGSHTTRNKTALTAAVLLALGTFSFLGMPGVAYADDPNPNSEDLIGVNQQYIDSNDNNTTKTHDGIWLQKNAKNWNGKGAHGVGAITIGINTEAATNTIAIGERNASVSQNSVYIGAKYDAKNQIYPSSGTNVVSVGYNSDAEGTGSIAIGSGAAADTFDNAGSGKNPDKDNKSIAIGYNANAKQNNIAIGAGSIATDKASTTAAAFTNQEASKSYVSVGDGTKGSDTQYRRITNVADGAAASDVATVGQLQELSKELGGYKPGFGIEIATDSTDKTKNKISLKRNLGRDANTQDKAVLKADEAKSALVIGGRVNQGDATGGQTTEKDYGALGQDSVTVGGADNTASGDAAVVVGGLSNTASAQYSTVVGGSANDAVGNESAVFGGHDNDAYGTYATSSGGSMNRAYGEAASVFGGSMNSALGASSVAVGGLNSTVNGTFAVGIAGGSTNADYALAAGNGANVTVENGTAIGYQATTDEAGTIAFGHDAGDAYYSSTTWPQKATKQNGKYYDANNKKITKAEYDALKNSDGTWNDYSKTPTVVEKTYDKAAYNRLVKVADGQDAHDVVVMEQLDKAKTDLTNNLSVKKGWGIKITDNGDNGKTIELERNLGNNSTSVTKVSDTGLILGGDFYGTYRPDEKYGNYGATGQYAVTLGGRSNRASGESSVAAGGRYNTANGNQSFVGGGNGNVATGSYSANLGGIGNNASGENSVVTGGAYNTASGTKSFVGGGYGNIAVGNYSAVIGGWDNRALGNPGGASIATVVGGYQNTANGYHSMVTGGYQNVAWGRDTLVSGGRYNTVLGEMEDGWTQQRLSDASAFGGEGSVVQGLGSVGLAGGSTGKTAYLALAAGYQSVVTDGAAKLEADFSDYGILPVYKDVASAIGYQSTANEAGTISFGHDAGDVSGYTVKWEEDNDPTHDKIDYGSNDYTKVPTVKENHYSDAYYNRLVKVADGIDNHDAVTKEQVQYIGGIYGTDKNDSNYGGKGATGTNSVAIGSNSVAAEDNVVSFGNPDIPAVNIPESQKITHSVSLSDTDKTAINNAVGFDVTKDENWSKISSFKDAAIASSLGSPSYEQDFEKLNNNPEFVKLLKKINNAIQDGTLTYEQYKSFEKYANGTEVETIDAVNIPAKAANYRRVVNMADGINPHDAVAMEQLEGYAKTDASNIGNKITVYKTDENGKSVEDTHATTAARNKSKDDWGKALGADSLTTAGAVSNSDQLITGKTLYNYDKPNADGTYVKLNQTTGQNLSALDTQVKANTDALTKPNHNIKYYAVDETTLPKLTNFNGKDYSNEENNGARGMGSIAAGFNTHADGIISTVAGSYSGVIGTGLQGATALSYGTFNVNQNTDTGKIFSGVANSIIGQANATIDSNAAIIYGAGNTVTNSYRKIDDTNASEIMQAASSKDVKKLDEVLQKAVPTSGGQVMVMGGGNNVESAYMTQVVGVGNTVKGNQVQNDKNEWVTDKSIKDYDPEKSSQYNYVDGFSNEVINGKHDYVIGANNKLSGDSYDDSNAQPIKRSNRSNIVIGDNHILTREQNTVIIGSIDTEDEHGKAQDTQTKARDAVIIGHNANATNDTGADNAVAIGRSAKATGGNAVTIGVNTSAGANSITIGSESSAISGSNIAIGRYARVYGDNVTNAVALGKLAEAHVAGGVAIGSNSIASTVAGKTGYDAQGKTHAATDADYAAWVSTDAAVSVGAAAHEVKYTDKDNKEQSKIVKSTRQITNLAAGTEDTDAVNVAQLKKLEGMKANVDASNIGENLKGADGKTASPEKITANKNAWGTALGVGMVADPTQSTTNDPTKNGSQQLVTGGTVFNETRISAKDDNGQAKTYNYLNANNSAGKNLEALDSALKTVSTTAGAHTVLTVEGNIQAGTGKDAKTNEDVYAGKNILLHESTDDTTGKVTYDLKLAKDINIGTPGKDGEDGKIGIDGRDGHIGLNGSDGITVRGLDGENGAPGKDGVTITGPKGADGIDGKVGISGTDGKDAVFISGKGGVGHIGLTGPAGTNGMDGADGKPGNSIDITVKNGYNVEGKDGKDGINGVDGVDGTSLTRIVYKDATGEHQIATMEDGLKFEGDDGKEIAKKLNNTLEIIGGAKGDLTDGNIGVNSTTDGKLKVQLADELTGIKSISNQKTVDGTTTGAKITLGDDSTVNVNGGKITNVGSGADASGKYTDATKTNAANIGDVQNIVNDAKKELTDGENGLNSKANVDASNIGTNLAADKQQDNLNKWGEAIGTGKVEANNSQLVTGKTVYDEVRPKKDGNYVKANQTTGENLSALDTKIGKLDNNGNYIKKDDTISKNLSTLDTHVKQNEEKITTIKNTVDSLDQNAVKYDDSTKGKISLAGEGGTTISNVKDGKLSDSSTDAVNGKQLWQEQQDRKNMKDISDTGKTVIRDLAKGSVKVVDGKNTTVTEGTEGDAKTYAVNVEGKGTVTSGNTGLISGGTAYTELRPADGTYVKRSSTTAANLSALDTGLTNTSSLIHTNTSGDTIHIGETSKATKVDVSSTDANGNKNGRVVTGVVTDAKDANSAANVGYVNGVTAANTQQIYREMNNAYGNLNRNINRAAAGSNALAALHPLDFDPADKASFAVGYGHYRNANAAAIGAFYYPNANTMVNVGVSVGNGDPGFNAGVSFKIGKGSAYNGVSKAEMAQTIHDQATEISAIKADDAAKDKRIDALEKENQEMKKQIQEILARLNG